MTTTADTQVISAARQIETAPVRNATAQSMLRLADEIRKAAPRMAVHRHLEDAADQVCIGNDEGALRHLKAAAWGLQPQSLHRHGVHHDRSHLAARGVLEDVVRHHHLVRDLQDAEARNQAVIARQAMEDAYGSPPLPRYGGDPGALAQRPVARQPGGDRALNAPARTNTGGPDKAVADPSGGQPPGSRQFARSWDEVCAVIELATVPVRAYKRTVQTRNGPREEVVRASARQAGAKAAEDDEEAAEGAVDRSHIRGWIPREKWLKGQQEWVARGKAARAAREAVREAKGRPVVPTSYDVDSIVDKVSKLDPRYRSSAAIHKVTGIDSGSMSKYGPMVNLYNDLQRGLTDPVGAAKFHAENVSKEAVSGQAERAEAIAQVLDRTEHEKPEEVARAARGLHEYARAVREALSGKGRAAAPETTRPSAPAAELPNTVVQPDPVTGALREMTQKEYAEILDKYSQTFRPGSIERGVWQQKAVDAARGGPEWQRLRRDSEPLRAVIAEEAAKAAKPVAGVPPVEERAGRALKEPVRSTRPVAGNERQLRLLGEREHGGDRTSGEMKTGDWQEGHQAIAQAPTGILPNETHRDVGGWSVRGSFSDPWWMAGPGGKFAVSRRWRSKAQDSYRWEDGKYVTKHIPAVDVRVITPVNSKGAALARSWDELAAVVDLSARTPYLAATPAPYGRPGGPGLYDLKGNRHAAYFEQVVQALMRKRGMPKGRASAVAWGALRRWASGRGHVHPEVRAAAAGGLAEEAKAAAKAKAAHGHAVSWEDITSAVELAAVRGGDGTTWDEVASVVDLAVVNVKTYQRTVQTRRGPVVQTIAQHPQNYKQGMASTALKPQAMKQSLAAQKPAAAAPQPLVPRAVQKQRLLATARADRRQAALLRVEEIALNSALFNALYGKNTTKAQAGATTAAQSGATTTASAPSQAQSAATTAIASGASQAQVTATQNQATAVAANMSVAQLRTAIAQVQAQIAWLNSRAAQLTAQAAKL